MTEFNHFQQVLAPSFDNSSHGFRTIEEFSRHSSCDPLERGSSPSVADEGEAGKPLRTKKSKGRLAGDPKSAKEARIPRPPNPWIVYRSHKILEFRAQHGENHRIKQADLSKMIGEMWRAETPESRKKYELEAEMLRIQHAKDYPDWKFTRSPAGSKSRGNRAATAPVPAKRRMSMSDADQGIPVSQLQTQIPTGPNKNDSLQQQINQIWSTFQNDVASNIPVMPSSDDFLPYTFGVNQPVMPHPLSESWTELDMGGSAAPESPAEWTDESSYGSAQYLTMPNTASGWPRTSGSVGLESTTYIV